MNPDDPELTRLLTRQFVPVRLTSLKGVDLSLFRFDYDLTMVGIVMDGRDDTILARWGARDGSSATTRLSLQGLNALLNRTAKDFADRKPGKPRTGPPVTLPDKFPTFAGTKRAGEACYHCHYAHDAEIAENRAKGTFRKAQLYLYPYPENVGLTLDADQGNVVKSVLPDSPAAKAGIKAGEHIEEVGKTTVYSTADFQWALNPIPDPGTVEMIVSRPGSRARGRLVTLNLPAGWRKSDISWRPSQGTVPPIIGVWEEPLSPDAKRKLGVPEDRMALRVSFLFKGEKWKAARGDLRMNDVIVAVGGVALPTMTPRQLHTYIRMNYDIGGEIPLTVLRNGQRIELRIPAVDVGLEE